MAYEGAGHGKAVAEVGAMAPQDHDRDGAPRSPGERALAALEHDILAGGIAAGSRLDPAELASSLGIPESAVHHALGSLARARLVTTTDDGRSFVRVIDLGEAATLCEVRASLELLVGRLAARHARPEDIDELRQIVKAMGLAARAGETLRWRGLDWRFHDRLARFSGNAALSAIYRNVANEYELYLCRSPQAAREDLREPTREHQAVLEALARRKGTRAANLLHEHAVEQVSRLRAIAQDAFAGRRDLHAGFG